MAPQKKQDLITKHEQAAIMIMMTDFYHFTIAVAVVVVAVVDTTVVDVDVVAAVVAVAILVVAVAVSLDTIAHVNEIGGYLPSAILNVSNNCLLKLLW